jgi:CheY-like chemotaxis protein
MTHILVIDDEADYRTMLAEMLRDAGYEVTEAADAHAGLEAFGRVAFDLIVTDILMPDGDGVEMVRGVAASGRKVPVIAISGGSYSLPAPLALAMTRAFGAIRSLYKPFRRQEFLKAVAESLAHPRD